MDFAVLIQVSTVKLKPENAERGDVTEAHALVSLESRSVHRETFAERFGRVGQGIEFGINGGPRYIGRSSDGVRMAQGRYDLFGVPIQVGIVLLS